VNLKADLTGSEETPASTGAGTGTIKVRVIVNHSPIEGSAILTKPTAKALDNDLLNGRFISISACGLPAR
jgi:hypothetical protein